MILKNSSITLCEAHIAFDKTWAIGKAARLSRSAQEKKPREGYSFNLHIRSTKSTDLYEIDGFLIDLKTLET